MRRFISILLSAVSLAALADTVYPFPGVTKTKRGDLRSSDYVLTDLNVTDMLYWWAGGSLFVGGDQTKTNYLVRTSVLNAAVAGKQDALSTAQTNAVNSGITSSKVATYDGYASSKQDALSPAQTDAINSGITAGKITAYDRYATSKQNALSAAQLNAVNSGVTSTKVSGYDSHVADGTVHVTAEQKTAWSAKQDALSPAQTNAINSGITSSKVATYDAHSTSIASLAATKVNASDVYTKEEIELVVLRNLVSATITNHLSNLTWDDTYHVMWRKRAAAGCLYECAYTNVNILVTGGTP